jgi:hypothetical protein
VYDTKGSLSRGVPWSVYLVRRSEPSAAKAVFLAFSMTDVVESVLA